MPKPLFAQQPRVAETDFLHAESTVISPVIQTQQSVGNVIPHRVTNFPVDILNPQAVANYGAQAQDKVAKFADEVLEYVKTSSTEQVGDKLVSIVSIAKELNISDLNGTTSKIPLIGGLIDSFNKRRDRFVSKFNSLKDQIDKVVLELDTSAGTLSKRIVFLDMLYDHNMEEYKELEVLVKNGKAFIVEQEQTFASQIAEAKLSGKISDPLVAQSYNDWQQAIARFSKRVSDLEAVQMMAVQTMPEIRMIQSGNQMLVEKFANAKTLTIPAWKKQFVLAVALDEQKKGAALAKTVDDATNDFYQANAKLLGENVISVAKTNQRAIIDLESLEVMQSTLINTFQEMQNIEAEGAKRRIETSARLGSMKKELYEKLVVQK